MLRPRIYECEQKLKFRIGGRRFAAVVYGAGRRASVEIEELDAATGSSCGCRRRYSLNGVRLKWGVVVSRYDEDNRRQLS
jgi:hypothetical protein